MTPGPGANSHHLVRAACKYANTVHVDQTERETFANVWSPFHADFPTHRAAADGFHTARLVQELQELFSDPFRLSR